MRALAGAVGAGLRRLVVELRSAPTAHDADAALARLRVRFEGDAVALIETSERGQRGDGNGGERGARAARGLDLLGAACVEVVRIEREVYVGVPTAEARVRLLSTAARALRSTRSTIDLHVPVSDDDSHVGRLAIDAPRRILRAFGARAAEPGDRFGLGRSMFGAARDVYVHCFFDEEMLLAEVGRAGLAVASRRGFVFTLRRMEGDEARRPSERAAPFAAELAHVARSIRGIERRRLRDTPHRVLADLRARGATAKERGPIGRARLRRAIGWVDAAHPGGPNCYRRVLLELALDAGAARETVVFGLDVGSTGHIAFEGREERSFDVAFSIPAAL